MRRPFFGEYAYEFGELIYKLRECEGGKVIAVIKDGDKYHAGWVNFTFKVVKDKKYGGRLMSVVRDKDGCCDILPDKKNILVATTPKTALNGYFKYPRKCKVEEDKLTKVMRNMNFMPECVEIVGKEAIEFKEVEIKSTYSASCKNFVGKQNYKYFCITDAKRLESLTVADSGCAICQKKRGIVCESPMKRNYLRLYEASFYVTYRRNLSTGKVQLMQVVMTKAANRDKIARKLQEI